jgi:hypothetical protein
MNPFGGIEEAGARGPVKSLELRRVLALPRRNWEIADDLQNLTTGLTRLLKRPHGTMTLKPTQAAALRDIYDHRGLFGPIGVGEGKTLITLLAPTLLEAERPLLLVPASLRDQTLQYVLPAMRKHWCVHPALEVRGYSELSLAKNATLLDDLRPDLIIADEVHKLKSLKSGRTRRIGRYMRKHPDTVFVALSGTIAAHSIMDYWHIIQWALKPDNSPMPKGWHEVQEWARALDERVREEDRLAPGALANMCLPGENVRQGYRRRLVETPGVVATREGRLGVSLQLLGLNKPRVPKDLQKTIEKVQETWETPDGEIIMEAVTLWRIVRELVCGYYYRWCPFPPPEWRDARRAWSQHVQHVLRTNRLGLDTPLQVEEDERRNGGHPDLERWDVAKKYYIPAHEMVLVDDYLIRAAAKWLKEPGICWVDSPPLGLEIAKRAKVKYYGAGDSTILKASGPIVASIRAHGTGKNLQQWNRSLVVCPPTAGGTWEQLLGRTHRTGQQEDVVTYEVYQHHESFRGAMEQAFKDAVFLRDSLGNDQRMLYCDTNMQRQRETT